MAALTPELVATKPAPDVHRAMFKDLVAAQKKVGTHDGYFVFAQGYPLTGGKKTSLVIVSSKRDVITGWFDRFETAKPKPKMLAQGTCTFAEVGREIVLNLKKITGGGRRPVIDAVAKGLAQDSRFAVHDALARDSESEESEGDERH